ncbi:MAG: ATP-binding protein, partial [Planctomycetota bacterium]
MEHDHTQPTAQTPDDTPTSEAGEVSTPHTSDSGADSGPSAGSDNGSAAPKTPTTEAGAPAEATPVHVYGERDIQVLEGLEAVRKRPGMYVGGTDVAALHHLVWEAVDNAIDEVMAGRATMCHVHVLADGAISVLDDGSGIPVGPVEHENPVLNGKPAVEDVMTVLHAGGKFDNSAYKVSGGLHGVGISCVNALSEWLEVEVTRNGKVYLITFERGQLNKPLHVIGSVPEGEKRSGTRVTFKPDPTIFPETDFDYAMLKRRLRELAYLNSGVKIRLTDDRVASDGKPRDEVFRFDEGVIAYVKYLAESKTPLTEPIYLARLDDDAQGLQCEVALQYTDSFNEHAMCFTNNILNTGGGTHLTGFKNALTRTLNNYAKQTNLLKDVTPSGDDLREGIVVVISFKHPDPQFNNQPKERLLS